MNLKEKNKESDEESLKISFDCTIKKSNNILEINIDLSYHSKFYRNILIIIGFCSLMLLVFFSIGEIFQGLLSLLFLFIISVPLLIILIYFKDQRLEWFFDKSNQIIKYQKITSFSDRIKEFDFSEIKSIIQKADVKFGCYNVSIKLITKKIYKIYIGEKEDVAYLGKIISAFINLPLSYETKIYYK